MTYAASLASISRTPVTLAVITLDYCANSWAVPPCSAGAWSIDFNPGVNWFQLPYTPVDTAIASVLSPVAGNYSIIWYWDGADWLRYIPGAGGNTLFTLEAGKDYDIRMNVADTLYGVDPTVLTRCYNTYPTCRDKTNFSRTTKDYKFVSADSPLPFKTGERPYIKSCSHLPTEIKDSLTVSSRLTIEMYDEPDTDVGIDPYLSTRSSVQGTYFKKLLARNTNWKGRPVKLYEGFDDLPEVDFAQKFVGVIDNITLEKGVVSVEVIDLLQSIDEIMIPPELDLELAVGMTDIAAALTLGGSDVTSLDATGYIRIDDEIIAYGAKNNTTKVLSALTRAQFGTIAVAHDAGTSVQKVRYFFPDSGFDHMQTILLTDCGIAAGYVDSTGIDAERDLDIGDTEVDFSAIVSEPTSAKELFFELVDLLNCKAWVGEDLKITVRRNFPNYPGRSYTTFTDTENIAIGSASVDLNKGSRLSRVLVYWDRTAVGEVDRISSYGRLDVGIDTIAEGVNEYNDIASKTIFCRWLRFGYDTDENMKTFVKNQCLRILGQFRDPMPIISLSLELKDSDIKTGGPVKLSTDELQDKDGNDLVLAPFLVVRREKEGHAIKVDLQRITPKKYLIIAPDAYDAKTYETATAAEREYGAICDDNNQMIGGDDGYRIY